MSEPTFQPPVSAGIMLPLTCPPVAFPRDEHRTGETKHPGAHSALVA